MKEAILYRQSNGVVAITTPVGSHTAQMVLDDSSEGGGSPALMSYVKNKHWTIIDIDNHIPTDSASWVFRDAWTITDANLKDNSIIESGKDSNSYIDIDMAKAKEIWKNEIRFERENALQKLDIEFQRAQEVSSDTTGIVARKQYFRNLPDKCDSASTIYDLLNIWDSDFQETAGGWYKTPPPRDE